MLKNINTGECIRVKSDEKDEYDKNIWLNPFAYMMKYNPTIYICPHCKREFKSKVCFERWHNDNCKLKI